MNVVRNKNTGRRLSAAVLLALAAGGASAGPLDAQDAAAPAAPEAAPAPQRRHTGLADRPYKSYGAAALEILAFQVLLNRVDHAFVKPDDYGVSVGSIRRNLRSSWVEDRDPFEINQIGHPYQGSVYYNLARVNGLNFWESMGYAFAGSAVWEIAGETTPPSRNDQITTSFGGSFLGEAFYRMANLVLVQGYGLPSTWREVAAGTVSPALGFNRYARPGRIAGAWDADSPEVFARLQIGASIHGHGNVGASLATERNEAAADFALDYGLPGKDGYAYRRPFDYFLFRLRLSNVQGVESIASRGLLWGAPYEGGRNLRGIAGLYGSYDYLSPQLFRVASTGLSLGTNGQWWMAQNLALQGHASAGIGYTSTGTVRASSGRQYSYGFAPQAVLMLRLIGGERFAIDLGAREFFDGKVSRPGTEGSDRVFRGDASFTYRVSGHHGVTVKYLTTRRRFSFPDIAERRQRFDTVGLYYTWLPRRGLGAVNW